MNKEISSSPYIRSPLRYPGGKTAIARKVEFILRKSLLSGSCFVEPYAGGAGLSLELLRNDVVGSCIWNEKDPLIYCFWKSVFSKTAELIKAIEDLPVTVDTWQLLQKHLSLNALKEFSTIENGLAGLFLNRMNFSGILSAKPIGGIEQNSKYTIDCRFNKHELTNRIASISYLRSRVTVNYGDAIKFLTRNQQRFNDGDTVVYIDPPYYIQGRRLYRYHYSNLQHSVLAKFIEAQPFPWIVSIDNHPDILSLYQNQVIVPISLNYTVNKTRKAEELIVSNLPLDDSAIPRLAFPLQGSLPLQDDARQAV